MLLAYHRTTHTDFCQVSFGEQKERFFTCDEVTHNTSLNAQHDVHSKVQFSLQDQEYLTAFILKQKQENNLFLWA